MTITVVTPSYNQGQYLEETIKSVLSQEGDFSLDYIIMDGGSTDNSVEIIKKYDSLFRRNEWPIRCRGIEYRWISEKDDGQTDAIMKGFRRAKGEVLAWLNSDDTYLPGALNKVSDFFRNKHDCDLVYGRTYYIDKDGRTFGQHASEPFSFARLALFNFICQPSTFFRKEAFLNSGGLDQSLHYAMDYDLWIRISRHGIVEYSQEFMSTYRFHDESKTVSASHALQRSRECLNTVVKYYHWAPANRVFEYSNHLVKYKLPAFLAKNKYMTFFSAIPLAAAMYLCLNKGVRLEDLKMLNVQNFKRAYQERYLP